MTQNYLEMICEVEKVSFSTVRRVLRKSLTESEVVLSPMILRLYGMLLT